MIRFGTPNPTSKTKHSVRHLCIKNFVPVFERIEEMYVPSRKFGEQGKVQNCPRYERWGYNFWAVAPTSKPRTVWAIYRVRRARLGQLKFL